MKKRKTIFAKANEIKRNIDKDLISYQDEEIVDELDDAGLWDMAYSTGFLDGLLWVLGLKVDNLRLNKGHSEAALPLKIKGDGYITFNELAEKLKGEEINVINSPRKVFFGTVKIGDAKDENTRTDSITTQRNI